MKKPIKAKKSKAKKSVEKLTFKNASLSQRRIMVAKDVLLQLAAKKLVAKAGAYVKLSTMPTYGHIILESDIQQNYRKVKECEVCALGACIMSATKLNNHLMFEDVHNTSNLIDSTNVKKLLSKLFTPKQLYMIETAFENVEVQGGIRYAKKAYKDMRDISEKEKEECVAFFRTYTDPEERLKAIMKNIIKNDGIFTPVNF